MKRRVNKFLATEEKSDLNIESPLLEYPRKQFERDSYFSLNGLWSYSISKDPNNYNLQGKILVPYCLESLNSQVQKELKKDEYLIYEKEFILKKDFIKDFTFLNILGIDQEFTLVINDIIFPHEVFLGVPLSIDVSKAIKEGKNIIKIICFDNLKLHIPHGKQVRNPKGMFYTSVSGIYFPLFLESVNRNYIHSLKIKTTLSQVTFIIDCDEEYTLSILENKQEIYKIKTGDKVLHVDIPSPHLWSNQNPFLYQVIITSSSDEIKSYFALREIKLIEEKVYLNNKKIFLNGLLDQGYFPEGIYTPSTYQSYEKDILTMKNLGFNLLRKHIKIECDYFYYLCDKLGMLVLQDFVNNSTYSYLHDTVIPTIGFQTFSDLKKHSNRLDRLYFMRHAFLVQDFLFNHPCVIGYTIFNEGWGQFKSDKLYQILKRRDSSRLHDSTSGWFRQKNSDFLSYHIYFKNISTELSKVNKKVFLSEFGGFSYKILENSFNLTKNYGYKYFTNQKDFEDAFVKLYEKEIIANKDKLVGAIYTQVSDVEDETNGLFTYDRKVLKVDSQRIYQLMKKLND